MRARIVYFGILVYSDYTYSYTLEERAHARMGIRQCENPLRETKTTTHQGMEAHYDINRCISKKRILVIN